MRYAIYARSATRDNHSIQKQVKDIKNALKENDAVYQIYKDNGVSGSTLNRPGMNRLFKAAEKKAFEGVFVTDFNRLSRSLKDYVILKDKLISNGLKIMTLSGVLLDDTASSRLVSTLVEGFSQFDHDLRSERIKKGLRARKLKKK